MITLFNISAVTDTCVLFSAVVRRRRFTPILEKRPNTEPLLRSRTVDVKPGFVLSWFVLSFHSLLILVVQVLICSLLYSMGQ